MMDNKPTFLRHEPCPNCGSRDNLARYSDDSAYCFGCQYREKGDQEEEPKVKRQEVTYTKSLIPGTTSEIKKRRITEETAKDFNFQVGTFGGESVQIFNYVNDDGIIQAQKIKNDKKDFKILGSDTKLPLFGKQLAKLKPTDVIYITEGEIDAMTVYQVLGRRHAVVSIPLGAGNAKASIAKELQFLAQYKKIVLCFDMDEPGQKALKSVIPLLPITKVKIVELPLKDASDMLVAKRDTELYDLLVGAKPYRPEACIKGDDAKAKARMKKPLGLPYWDPRVTKATGGRPIGSISTLGGGTGCGKTDNFLQQMEYDIFTLKEKVGIFFFEQECDETITRLAAKHAGIPYIKMRNEDGDLTPEADKAIEDIPSDYFNFFNLFGVAEWQGVRDTIRYWYHAEGIRIFYIDHLTALATGNGEDEKKLLELIMAELGGLVKEIPILIQMISHLSTPEGKPHEEGGRVMIKHFKGSRAIGYWNHFMYGLERNTQSDNLQEKNTSTLRVLKDRVSGQSLGMTFKYIYDSERGLLVPLEPGDFLPVSSGNDDF